MLKNRRQHVFQRWSNAISSASNIREILRVFDQIRSSYQYSQWVAGLYISYIKKYAATKIQKNSTIVCIFNTALTFNQTHQTKRQNMEIRAKHYCNLVSDQNAYRNQCNQEKNDYEMKFWLWFKLNLYMHVLKSRMVCGLW